jgi:hypothetical protein
MYSVLSVQLHVYYIHCDVYHIALFDWYIYFQMINIEMIWVGEWLLLLSSVRNSVLSSPIEWLPPVGHLVRYFTYVCTMPWELSRVSSKTIDVNYGSHFGQRYVPFFVSIYILLINYIIFRQFCLLIWCPPWLSNTNVCVTMHAPRN